MEQDILKSLEVLKAGGVILYPTDTIWGIGCDATNAQAVEKIYAIKQRSDTQSLIVLVDDAGRLASYSNSIPAMAFDLIEFSEKPLTLIFDGAKNLAPNVIHPDGSIGMRVCREAFCRKLISRFRKPIVSTSANFSGECAPSLYSEIKHELIKQVDYVVQWRQNDNTKAVPSTIIKLGEGGLIKIIRE